MYHRIEAHIRPILRHDKKTIEVQTIEEKKEEFPSIYSVGNMLRNDRRGRIIGAGIAIILASDAAIELSKAIFPFVTNTPPLNQWYPILEQISTISETPIVVGVLAAIGAIYVGKNALNDKLRFKGIRHAYDQIECSPADFPIQPPTNPNPPIP